jgi:hypothetical protein
MLTARDTGPAPCRAFPEAHEASCTARRPPVLLPGMAYLTQRPGDGRATADLRPTPPTSRGDTSRAGSDDGGPSSSDASISTTRTRTRPSSSSRSDDGELPSRCRASSRSRISRSSSGSAIGGRSYPRNHIALIPSGWQKVGSGGPGRRSPAAQSGRPSLVACPLLDFAPSAPEMPTLRLGHAERSARLGGYPRRDRAF